MKENADKTLNAHQEIGFSSFIEVFQAHVAARGEADAIIWKGRLRSYRELNQQSNRFAHYLCARGIGPETLVGVYMERCPAMIAAMLGIFKAGAAYVPLD